LLASARFELNVVESREKSMQDNQLPCRGKS